MDKVQTRQQKGLEKLMPGAGNFECADVCDSEGSLTGNSSLSPNDGRKVMVVCL